MTKSGIGAAPATDEGSGVRRLNLLKAATVKYVRFGPGGKAVTVSAAATVTETPLKGSLVQLISARRLQVQTLKPYSRAKRSIGFVQISWNVSQSQAV